MKDDQLALIRALNDRLRKEHRGGRILVTAGVLAHGDEFFIRVLTAIAQCDVFNEENDPWGEHDFGAICESGERVFWKIDYYNKTLTAAAEDPANPAVCQRILTIMLASEY